MKTIYNFSLLDILPETFTSDPTIHAICLAIDKEINKLSNATKETLHLPRIDKLPESVLDLLAWQWHVDFYEPIGMDINTKRELIKKAISAHRIKGTPAAVENLFSNIFKGGKIEEWFEYGGNPYHFKITALGKQIASEEQLTEFKHALETTKNVRSWLDGFEVSITELLEWYLGTVLSELIANQYQPILSNQQVNSLIKPGFANISSEFIKKSLEIANNLPKMRLNYGIKRQEYETNVILSNVDDEFTHDLRSTALLDLLLVGLGIVREGSDNPINEWIYRNNKAKLAIYMQEMQINRENIGISNKYAELLQYTTDFIRSESINRSFLSILSQSYKIDTRMVMNAYSTIINQIKDITDEYKPMPNIIYRKVMRYCTELIQQSLTEEKHYISMPEIKIVDFLNFSAIFVENILQKIENDDRIQTDDHVTISKINRIITGLSLLSHSDSLLSNLLTFDKYTHNIVNKQITKIHQENKIKPIISTEYSLSKYIGIMIRSLLMMKYKPEEVSKQMQNWFTNKVRYAATLSTYSDISVKENDIREQRANIINMMTIGIESIVNKLTDESPINTQTVQIVKRLPIYYGNEIMSQSVTNLIDSESGLHDINNQVRIVMIPVVSTVKKIKSAENPNIENHISINENLNYYLGIPVIVNTEVKPSEDVKKRAYSIQMAMIENPIIHSTIEKSALDCHKSYDCITKADFFYSVGIQRKYITERSPIYILKNIISRLYTDIIVKTLQHNKAVIELETKRINNRENIGLVSSITTQNRYPSELVDNVPVNRNITLQLHQTIISYQFTNKQVMNKLQKRLKNPITEGITCYEYKYIKYNEHAPYIYKMR